MGAKIGKGSTISVGALIFSKDINIGDNVSIGPLTFIKAEKLQIDSHSLIKSFTIISTREISIAKYVHFSPFVIVMGDFTKKSIFSVGDHSRFFPFCWLEPGEGITIGKHVGIGGHTLIFTHGAWSNYLNGGPINYGPVIINDNVWLPWRVFIMPNVTIGKNAIVGANSLVNRNVPENFIVAGSPAKAVSEEANKHLSDEEKLVRVRRIVSDFKSHLDFKFKLNSELIEDGISVKNFKIVINNIESAKEGDLILNCNPSLLEMIRLNKVSVIDLTSNSVYLQKSEYSNLQYEFLSFLRRYGIRLYIYDFS